MRVPAAEEVEDALQVLGRDGAIAVQTARNLQACMARLKRLEREGTDAEKQAAATMRYMIYDNLVPKG